METLSNSQDLEINREGIIIKGEFIPRNLVVSAGLIPRSVDWKYLAGSVIMLLLSYWLWGVIKLFGWCFLIGGLGLLVGGIASIYDKHYFLFIMLRDEDSSRAIIYYDLAAGMRAMNSINDLNKESDEPDEEA